ncbi:2-amino-4-hydroxy-6-hydroxymethyldihydropteridine diphosphokinase [Roseiflexus castenholzii]|uniref:2-amino-4-hydroxy-6- hydroxymethyldihydropteridine diphosphokinase n=1 Tax=Roseiflexus castenholzii TaxID=120962 RepID=UPI003C7AA370
MLEVIICDSVTMRSTTVYIGLGSNLGDRVARLREAVERLRRIIDVTRVSHLYVHAPPGYVSDDAFINAVLEGHTTLKPLELLAELQKIERAMGRRRGIQYGPRPIDLDILLYGTLQMESLELTIPHPRLAERAFVLKPLAEIAPNLMHPVLYYTITQLLSDVDDADQVRLFNPGGNR